jgi:hypothetical protein
MIDEVNFRPSMIYPMASVNAGRACGGIQPVVSQCVGKSRIRLIVYDFSISFECGESLLRGLGTEGDCHKRRKV